MNAIGEKLWDSQKVLRHRPLPTDRWLPRHVLPFKGLLTLAALRVFIRELLRLGTIPRLRAEGKEPAISKTIIESDGQTIRAENKAERGAPFRFTVRAV